MARGRWKKRRPPGPPNGPPRPKLNRDSAKIAELAHVPLNCTVLAIDTASKSGFAVRVRGALRTSGELNTEDPRGVAWVVSRAVAIAAESQSVLVVVLETPYGGNRTTLLGLGAARERWMAAIRGFPIPKRRILSVMPLRWRRPLFGPAVVRARRDQIRAWELASAQSETGLANIGPDEAAAIGISRWAARAPQVGRVLPRR